MDIDKKRAVVSNLKRDIALKQKQLAKTEKEIAKHLCPFSIGDLITRGHGVAQVVNIVPSVFPIGYEMILRPIREDGHGGRYTHRDTGHGYSIAT
jgi:hypothetical protein